MSEIESLKNIVEKTNLDSEALRMAIELGETPLDNPYHNELHVRKVVLQMVRIMEISDDLSDAERELLIIAACIHDLGHTGGANDRAGALESRSIDLAAPSLAPLGVDMTALTTMILCTDVRFYTPQLKAAYRAHFEGGEMPKLPKEIQSLATNKRLTLLSMILHEADIATSSGIDYETTKQETKNLYKEFGANSAQPSHIIEFLDDICGRTMMTEAAKQLYNVNMAAIYDQAQSDLAQGNKFFG